jgi:chemotaxis protein MotB
VAKKERKKIGGGVGPWVLTYGDMVTLVLCFFVAIYDPSEADVQQTEALISSFNNIGLGPSAGGATMSSGKMAELGNTISSLPSMEKGRSLGTSLKRAISLFNPEIKSNKVRVTHDERGLVVTLASDAFFRPASDQLDIEESRDLFIRLSELLKPEALAGSKFRIEGHTDSEPVDPASKFKSNWELSAARSINVLRFLLDFGVEEKRFQVAGFSDTVPLASNETREGRAYNRRVDILILDPGHL